MCLFRGFYFREALVCLGFAGKGSGLCSLRAFGDVEQSVVGRDDQEICFPGARLICE